MHLGDWGLQMGLIIAELQDRQPDLPYFDPDFTGEYPAEAALHHVGAWRSIYPAASARKQGGRSLCRSAPTPRPLSCSRAAGATARIWQHIMNVSVADLRRNYDNLDVQL